MFMDYRPCPDLTEPPQPPADTPDMIEAARAVERGERHGRMLARLAEIGMELAEDLAERARAEKEADIADVAGAFAKIAQAVRRTIALEAHLGEGVGARRTGLIAERASRRAAAGAAHHEAKDRAIRAAVEDAIIDTFAADEPDESIDELTCDMEELLCEADDFSDYLQRPVGETVARLCQALGLDPRWAIEGGEGWVVKSPPFCLLSGRVGRETRGAAAEPSAPKPPPLKRPRSSAALPP